MRIRSRTLWWVSLVTVGLLFIASPGVAYVRPGETQWVSRPVKGLNDVLASFQSNFNSDNTAISEDGRLIAFDSHAPNLVEDDVNGPLSDVFVQDRKTGKTELASVSSGGIQGVGASPSTGVSVASQNSKYPSMTPDGRYIAFSSYAPNLVPGDTNGAGDVFVRDRRAGTTERVSIDSSGKESNEPPLGGFLAHTAISSNGRLVVFASNASNLVPGDTNGAKDVFLHDRKTDKTTRISVSSSGEESSGPSDTEVSISANGRFIQFGSDASNLVPDDTNASWDVFLFDVRKRKTELISKAPDGTRALPLQWSKPAFGQGISADGRYVVFSSIASNFVPRDSNGRTFREIDGMDAFVLDRQENRLERVSVSPSGEQAGTQARSFVQSISPDGRFVLISSAAPLASDDSEDPFSSRTVTGSLYEGMDTYLHDRDTGDTELVSRNSEGEGSSSCEEPATNLGLPSAGGMPHVAEYSPSMTSDGRFVAFAACSRNLPNGGGSGPGLPLPYSIYVRDRGAQVGAAALNAKPDGATRSASTASVEQPAIASFADDSDPHLFGASAIFRPWRHDVFVRIELKDMKALRAGADEDIAGGSPITTYGLRFTAEGKRYEVRATTFLGGTFGLFDCTSSVCKKVAGLPGGFGTTGTRVVFSLPLDEIGLEDGGGLEKVHAYAALGTFLTDATKILESIRLR